MKRRIRKRSRPRQHTRRLRSGKRTTVNRGVRKGRRKSRNRRRPSPNYYKRWELSDIKGNKMHGQILDWKNPDAELSEALEIRKLKRRKNWGQNYGFVQGVKHLRRKASTPYTDDYVYYKGVLADLDARQLRTGQDDRAARNMALDALISLRDANPGQYERLERGYYRTRLSLGGSR